MDVPEQSMPAPAPLVESDDEDINASDNERDSGGNKALEGTVLSAEDKLRVIKQVDFYFSDASLPSDKKLLKHIRKDPMGWVAVKLVANFRKVRAISRDVVAIAEALKGSTVLAVSEDLKQIRRIIPVPEYDIEEIQKRTVVVENLPIGSTIESVTKMMKPYGRIKLVRICSKETKGKLPTWLTTALGTLMIQPGPTTGAAAGGGSGGGLTTRGSGSLASQPSEKPPHAYVEFETEGDAVMAVAALHDTEGWRPLGVQVSHLVYPSSDTMKAKLAPKLVGRSSQALSHRNSRDHSPSLVSHNSERSSIQTASSWRSKGLSSGPQSSITAASSGGSTLQPRSTHIAHDAMSQGGWGSPRAGNTSQQTGLSTPTNSVGASSSNNSGELKGRKSERYVPPARRGMDSNGANSPTEPGSPTRSPGVNNNIYSKVPGSPARAASRLSLATASSLHVDSSHSLSLVSVDGVQAPNLNPFALSHLKLGGPGSTGSDSNSSTPTAVQALNVAKAPKFALGLPISNNNTSSQQDKLQARNSGAISHKLSIDAAEFQPSSSFTSGSAAAVTAATAHGPSDEPANGDGFDFTGLTARNTLAPVMECCESRSSIEGTQSLTASFGGLSTNNSTRLMQTNSNAELTTTTDNIFDNVERTSRPSGTSAHNKGNSADQSADLTTRDSAVDGALDRTSAGSVGKVRHTRRGSRGGSRSRRNSSSQAADLAAFAAQAGGPGNNPTGGLLSTRNSANRSLEAQTATAQTRNDRIVDSSNGKLETAVAKGLLLLQGKLGSENPADTNLVSKLASVCSDQSLDGPLIRAVPDALTPCNSKTTPTQHSHHEATVPAPLVVVAHGPDGTKGFHGRRSVTVASQPAN